MTRCFFFKPVQELRIYVADELQMTVIKNSQHQSNKRGRLAIEEWQARARYVLRHLDDPIALQRSPLCRLAALERMAKLKYPSGIVAEGRYLNELAIDCIKEIEEELGDYAGVNKLKAFITLTRQGKGVTEASRELELSHEHVCRSYERILVKLLAQKLMGTLH